MGEEKAMFCEHANECPARCSCGSDCYCKTHTCKSTVGGSFVFLAGRNEGGDSPEPAKIELRANGQIWINDRLAGTDEEVVCAIRMFVRSLEPMASATRQIMVDVVQQTLSKPVAESVVDEIVNRLRTRAV